MPATPITVTTPAGRTMTYETESGNLSKFCFNNGLRAYPIHQAVQPMGSTAADPIMTIGNFNRQFSLGEMEKSAVEWAWQREAGETMFHVVNAYTRAAAMEGLPAESSFRLQRVGGEVLSLLS